MPSPRKRLLPALSFVLFCLAASCATAAGQDTPPPKEAAPIAAAKGWIGKQLSHFKGYPHLDMAYRRLKEHNLGDAAKEFTLYLQIQPDDIQARADFMNLLYAMGRYQDARAEARRILAAKPDDADALLTSGLSIMRAGDPQSALAPMEQAVALSKNNPVKHRIAVMATADLLGQLGRYPDAMRLLDGLSDKPADFGLERSKGVFLSKQGENAKALAAYRNALSAAGNDKEKLEALRALAVISAAAGDVEAARAYLSKARDLDPEDAPLLRQQAVLAQQAGNHEQALHLGRELVRLDPSVENTVFVATQLASMRQFDDAAQELRPLLKRTLRPKQAYRVNMSLGVYALEAGKPEEAAAFLRDAVAIRREPLALVRLSRVEQQLGHIPEAAKALREAVALGASPDAMLELATLLSKLDQNVAALDYLDKALETSQTPEARARTLAMKAALLSEKGDNAGARQTLEEAVKTPGGDKPRLLSELGETNLRLGDNAAAVTAFGQAVDAGAGAEMQSALAEALVRDGKPEQALGVYKKLAETAQTPERRNAARLATANLLVRLGQHAEAAEIFLSLAKSGQPGMLLKAGQSFLAARQDGKAIAAFEASASQAGSQSAKAEALIALGNVYAGRREAKKAYTTFTQASRLAADLPKDKQADLALGRGTAAMLAGEPAKAVEPFTQALRLVDDGSRKARALMSLGQAYGTLGDAKNAAEAWKRAAAMPGALRTDVASAEENLGYILSTAGDLAGAEKAFLSALTASGPNWRLLAALGQVAFKAGRYQDALDDFNRSLTLHPDVTTRIALGRSYEKLGKPGLALYAFAKAAPEVDALPPAQRREFYLARGFLYAEEFRYDAAVAAFKTAQALGYDPETATRLGRLERLSGHAKEAWATLQAINPSRLPDDLRLLRLSEMASLAEAGKNYDKARELLEACMAIKPDPDTAFRLGNVLRDSGHGKEAVAAYRKAVDLDDADRYLTALGYALNDAKQYAEAAPIFEKVLARDPDYLSLWEDLGYDAMHMCDNAKSVASFKRAIDNAPLRPVDTPADKEKVEKDVYRMRKEVTKLETHFTTTAYMSYIAGDAGPMPGTGGESTNTIRSGAGVEFAWIPPVVGFRDDRILQAISRFSANLNKDSLEFDDKSWQGAVGLRYKPFKTQNLNLGFERLFKIGQSAEENWLLRAMYSLTDGYDVKPKEKHWNYSFLYGEYDYYMQNDRRSMFYVEGRQGITFNVNDRFLITPHVVADARLWTPDINESSYVEGGPGLSVKFLFNRAPYEVDRSSLEFLLQYKYGTLFNKTQVTDRENVINALFLTTIIKF